MNRMGCNILIGITIVHMCGCAQQLQHLNNALAETNRALAGGINATNKPGMYPSNTPTMSAPDMPVMSEAQGQAIRIHLSSKLGDRALLQAREEAKDNIEKILAISACFPGWQIHRYLAAYSMEGRGDHETPMLGMNYHPKSQCLGIARIDNWKMSAKNAFSFRAVFVSEASAESRSIHYEMVKQPDGTWLLN
jgi:hypothetical protein